MYLKSYMIFVWSNIKIMEIDCHHEMDNSFIHCGLMETLRDAKQHDYTFIGVELAPYPHMNQYYAAVWYDEQENEKFWCHISELVYEQWVKESERLSETKVF